MRELTELWVRDAVQWLRLGIELVGAVIVALGVIIGGVRFVAALAQRRAADFTAIRLVLARYLAVALEFQLGADILSTAVAPTWNEIGQLAAIAVIRTALNYFLGQEMREEQATQSAERRVTAHAGLPTE